MEGRLYVHHSVGKVLDMEHHFIMVQAVGVYTYYYLHKDHFLILRGPFLLMQFRYFSLGLQFHLILMLRVILRG